MSLVNADTLLVSATASVGRHPLALALDRRRQRLYVANGGDDTVSVLNSASLAVLATVAVGRLPHALVLEPRSGCVYVANAASNSVSVIACEGASGRAPATRFASGRR